MKPLFSFLSVLLITVAAAAQTQTVSDTIVVTASALPEKVDETPASVSVVTQKEIEAIAATDVADCSAIPRLIQRFLRSGLEA